MNIMGDTVMFSDQNENELLVGGYSNNVLSIFDIRYSSGIHNHNNSFLSKLVNENFHVLSMSQFNSKSEFGHIIALGCSKVNQIKIYSHEKSGRLTNIDTLFNIPNPVFSTFFSNNYLSYCCAKESFTVLKHKYK